MINQKWVFGRKAGLDFSTPIPTPTSGFQINTSEGCASISDANGTLLFYTDGSSIWDSTHTLRASGLASGLGGNQSSTQSAIIVPDPGNNQQCYACTTDGSSGTNNHFNGIRINVSSWATVPLSSLMTMPPTAGWSPTEKVTAIQHANCVDYWVITVVQESGNLSADNGLGSFQVFLVDSSGVQYIGATATGVRIADLGYLKASPDGLRLAVANFQNQNVLVYNFDNAVGVIDISSLVTIAVPRSYP